MPTTLHVNALGVDVSVELVGLSDAQLTSFAESWSRCPPFLESPYKASVKAAINSGDATDSSTLAAEGFDELFDRLTARITVAAIETRKHDLLMLHAGGVSDPDTGAVVAFIGPSGRGKTTASVALAQRLGYVTDETVGIRDDLSVVAYPKPLSIKQPTAGAWKVQTGPNELRLQSSGVVPLRLTALVMLDRNPDYPAGALPQITKISLSDAISELVPQISYLPTREAPLHRLRSIINACGGLHRVTYRESGTLIQVVEGLLRDAPQPLEVVDAESLRQGLRPTLGVGEVSRAHVDDYIVDGHNTVILYDGIVRVLDGIAPTIWRAIAEGADRKTVVAAVVEEHGVPPHGDADAMVNAALDELAAAGLIRLGI